MTWSGTEAILDAVKSVLQSGMSAKLATVAARYTATPLTLTAPDTTTGYLTALIDNRQDALRDQLQKLTLPSVVILAGNVEPAGERDIAGRCDTITDVIVAVRVKASTLAESDLLLLRYLCAVNELLTANAALGSCYCQYAGESITAAEIPDSETYLLRTRGTAFRVTSYDEGA